MSAIECVRPVVASRRRRLHACVRGRRVVMADVAEIRCKGSARLTTMGLERAAAAESEPMPIVDTLDLVVMRKVAV